MKTKIIFKHSILLLLQCLAITLFSQDSTSKIVFSYTGADQIWTAPPGITEITVKAWGAGGAGGNYVFNDIGGGGGFVSGRLHVKPGEQLAIIVGGGGQPGAGPGAYGGGGAKDFGPGGRGGGRSAVINSPGKELITAGA